MMGKAIMTTGVPGPGSPIARQGAAEQDGQQHRLVCRTGSQLWAVPLECVIEVMRPLPVKPVSKAPHWVLGLCVIRGAPVLVLDSGLLIGRQATDCGRLITVRTGSRTIALAAEAVLGIWAIGADTLTPLPPLLGDDAADTISAVGSRDTELLFLLQATRIVPDDLHDQLVREGGQL